MCDYQKQGIACADAQNTIEGMKQLREAAKDCKTRADYVAFMSKVMPVDVEEVADGILLHLHKKFCTCVHPEFIQKCGSNLCECTKAHEEYTWSIFFGKPVKVEIVESFLRGGKDCVSTLRAHAGDGYMVGNDCQFYRILAIYCCQFLKFQALNGEKSVVLPKILHFGTFTLPARILIFRR